MNMRGNGGGYLYIGLSIYNILEQLGIDLYLICSNGGFACAVQLLSAVRCCFTPLYTRREISRSSSSRFFLLFTFFV